MTHNPKPSARAEHSRWWESHKEHYSAPLISYFRNEFKATAARHYQPFVFPAVMQTPEYADAVLRAYRGKHTDALIDRTRQVRELRREIFLSNTMNYTAVLDAATLRRPVGSDTVMQEQIDWLRELDSTGRAKIAIVDGVYPGMVNDFTLLTVAGDTVAFASDDESTVRANNVRRNKLITCFDGYKEFATPLRDYSL